MQFRISDVQTACPKYTTVTKNDVQTACQKYTTMTKKKICKLHVQNIQQ